MAESTPLKYEKVMQEFLSLMEWEDELEVNTESQVVSLLTNIVLSGQTQRGVIEAKSKNDHFHFYIYLVTLRCKTKKIVQMKLLLTEINSRLSFGCFEYYLAEDAFGVRWRHQVDFEGAAPSGLTIKNNFTPSFDFVELFWDTLTAVAITNQSADDAIAEYDEEIKNKEQADEAAQQESDDVPSEL